MTDHDTSTTRDRSVQAYAMAHLRPLGRCRTCGAPAVEQLYSGVNAPMGVYCSRHAKRALREFKAGAR